MRLGIRLGGKPITKSFEDKVGGVIKAIFDIAEMQKAGGYKYVKREGSPGHYKYWYRLPDGSLGSRADLKAANGKKPAEQGGEKKGPDLPDTPENKLMQQFWSGEVSREQAKEKLLEMGVLPKYVDGNLDAWESSKYYKGGGAAGKQPQKKQGQKQNNQHQTVTAAEGKKLQATREKNMRGLKAGEKLVVIPINPNDPKRNVEFLEYVEEGKDSRAWVKELDGKKRVVDLATLQKPQKLGLRVLAGKENENGNGNGAGTGFPGSVAQGDIITGKDAYTGQSVTGKVSEKGHDGVTVESKNGVIHKIRWSEIDKKIEIINDHDAIRKIYDKEAIVGGWRGGDDGTQPESCDNIGGLLKAAESDRENLNKLTGKYADIFADLSPVLIKRPVLKDEVRIKEKLREDEEAARKKDPEYKKHKKGAIYDKETDTYHCRTIRDTDGHTLTLNSVADVGKLLHSFNEDEVVIRIKNNFADPTDLGYSDINMNVRLPNGTIAEIQLNTTANLVAKERYGHSMYEVWRTINGMDDDVKKEHAELLELMIDGQKALYGKANEFSKDGTYQLNASVKSEIDNGNTAAIFKEDNPEYVRITKPFIEKALPLFERAVKEGLFPKTEEGKENKAIGHFRELAERLKNA